MIRGTVKKWDAARGFGFLRRQDGAGDVFIHIKTLQQAGINDVSIGDEFSFLVERGPDCRERAAEPQRIDEPSRQEITRTGGWR